MRGRRLLALLAAFIFTIATTAAMAADTRLLLDEGRLRPYAFATGTIEVDGETGPALRIQGRLWNGSVLPLFLSSDPGSPELRFLIHVPPELRSLLLETERPAGKWELLVEKAVDSEAAAPFAAPPDLPLHSPLSGQAPSTFEGGGRDARDLARAALALLFATPRPLASALALAAALLVATTLRAARGGKGDRRLVLPSLAILAPILGCAAALALLPPRAELFTLPLSEGKSVPSSYQLVLSRSGAGGYAVSDWEGKEGAQAGERRLFAARTPPSKPLPLHLLAGGMGFEAPGGLWRFRPEPLVRMEGGEPCLDFGGLGLAWREADAGR